MAFSQESLHSLPTLPANFRFLVLWPALVQLWWKRLLKGVLAGQAMRSFNNCQALRGMSLWVVDWVGGYPFEVAKPEEIFDFYF